MTLFDSTYKRHLKYSFLRGPAIALSTQLASFVAIKSLGATERQAIIVSFAIPAGNLLAILWSRVLAHRLRIPFAVWPDFVGFLILLPILFVVKAETFITLVFLTTLLRAPTIVALAGVVRDNYPAEYRARTLGNVQAMALGSIALSGWIFGLILDKDPTAYRWLFPLSAGLGLFSVLQLRGVPEADPKMRAREQRASIWDVFRILNRDRDFLRYEMTYFCFGVGAIMYSTMLPLYMAQDLLADYREGALALVVLASALPVLTSPLWGWVIDRANVLFLRGVFNVLWALCPLIVYLLHSMPGVYAAQFLVGLTTGGSALIWTLGINIFAPQKLVPTYMGIHTTLTGLRGLLAPAIGLWLAYRFQADDVPGYRTVFLLCFVLMAGAGVYMFYEARQLERRGRATTFVSAEASNG